MSAGVWDEERFIQSLQASFLPPGSSALVGIGDDCAVIPQGDGTSWLITTDALVEGVHFLKEQIPPKELGYKAVAVSVSDIAAMGGEPRYAFLSIAMAPPLDSSWSAQLLLGIREACQRWGILLLGGDTVGSRRDLFLNIALVGSAANDKIKYRHQAVEGDRLCVSSCLGNAGGGWQALSTGIALDELATELVHSHFHPEPSPEQGCWLAAHEGVHAMMDLSDGLQQDLQRLLCSSQKGAIVELSKLPLSPTLQQLSRRHQWDPIELALTGGEDYCLLVAIAPESCQQLQADFHKQFGSFLYEVGQITSATGKLLYQDHGDAVDLRYSSFDHFSPTGHEAPKP